MVTVRDLAVLARDADMQSSYKPALLKALVQLVRFEPAMTYTRQQLAQRFLSLYWNQTVVYHLRQAASLARELIVIREIRATADEHGVRFLRDLPSAAAERLAARLASGALPVVLGAFHGSAPAEMPKLFTWQTGDAVVRLTEAGFACLATHGLEIEVVTNYWWARYLERVNKLARFIIKKVEGAERGSLLPYLKILRRHNGADCFYCGRGLEDGRQTHVDHVLPWSFLLEDELWDLVLACASCNLAKSDRLPERGFIDRLAARNGRLRLDRAVAPRAFSTLVHDVDIYRLYDAAIALEWPGPWRPFGGAHALRGDEKRELGPTNLA